MLPFITERLVKIIEFKRQPVVLEVDYLVMTRCGVRIIPKNLGDVVEGSPVKVPLVHEMYVSPVPITLNVLFGFAHASSEKTDQ